MPSADTPLSDYSQEEAQNRTESIITEPNLGDDRNLILQTLTIQNKYRSM